MIFTRRSFIEKVGLAVVAAATVGPVQNALGQRRQLPAFEMPQESLSDPLNFLTRQHFEPFVDSTFTVRGMQGKDVRLVLTQVKDLERKSNVERGYQGDSFSLLFQGSGTKTLTQNTYSFRHDALGELTLLAVPVGSTRSLYEVIVNRIHK